MKNPLYSKIKYLNLTLLFLGLFVSACSTNIIFKPKKKVRVYNSTINVAPSEINLWVDKMPGNRKNLQITGRLKVSKSKKYKLNFLQLSRIHIYQNDRLLVQLKPRVRRDKRRSDSRFLYLKFTTTSGVFPSPELNLKRRVNIEFIFNDNNREFSYFIKNHKIIITE